MDGLSPTRYLATYFDRAYLLKGLALLRSIDQHIPRWHLYVLALDDETFDIIGALAATTYRGRVTVARLKLIESRELLALRAGRSWKEYIWTLTPFWLDYVFNRYEPPDLAYIDADCYFFGGVDLLYASLYPTIGGPRASVGITPHRWTPRHADRLRPNGIYNVGWVYVADDHIGRRCLDEWRDACAHWRPTPSQPVFSDQVFLDDWPYRYGAAIIYSYGANLAPWNQEQYTYEIGGDGGLWMHAHISDDRVSSARLIFYHFHEMRFTETGRNITNIYRTGYPLHPIVSQQVYAPYEAVLREIASGL